jgi:hypothetical protein
MHIDITLAGPAVVVAVLSACLPMTTPGKPQKNNDFQYTI